jgi:hypothetical protein
MPFYSLSASEEEIVRLKSLFMSGLMMVVGGTVARAALSFVLTPSARVGSQGMEVFFTGILSNTDPTNDVYLNDIQFVASSNLTTVANTFFANVPGILSAGQTYSDIVFAVIIEPTTPIGNYFATVAILGGSNIFASSNLGTQSFEVSVSEVTPFSAWQLAEFGANATNTVISGDLADPDGDGIANLLEYALGLNPNMASVAGLPTAQTDPACGCLSLTYIKVLSATDLTYTAEAANDPGGLWSTNGIAQTVLGTDGVTQTNKASDASNPIGTSGNRFMHLRVTRQ